MSRAAESPIGLLFSGGLDSSILAGELCRQGHRVQPIYVVSQLFWEADELRSAKKFLKAIASPPLRELAILQMPAHDLYGNHWSVTGFDVPDADSPDEAVYLPGRNPLLLLKARMWCQLNGISRLAIGCLGSNPFVDASDEFFVALGTLLDQATDSIVEIIRPMARFSKRQLMQLGRELPLELTFSCIHPQDGLHCGQCNKCAERRAAFQLQETGDPTRYSPTITAKQLAR
jgi:7-cyano-7-deazaguanine synthase